MTLPFFQLLSSDKFWYVFQDEIDGEIVNVWIFEEEDEDDDEVIHTSYSVIVKKQYRFHLLQVGDEWMVSVREGTVLADADKKLAEKIEDLLIAIL